MLYVTCDLDIRVKLSFFLTTLLLIIIDLVNAVAEPIKQEQNTYNNSADESFFVAQKQCNSYLFETNMSPTSVWKKHDKIKIDEKYKIKEFQKINNRNYVVIYTNADGGENELLLFVNSSCGYVNLDHRNRNFKEIFDSEHVSKLDNLSMFDTSVLEICGSFGSRPKKSEFIKLLSDTKFEKEYNELYQHIDGRLLLKDRNEDKDEFIKNIANLMFDNSGFSHIFCGIIKDKKLSGLHFYPRFLELQKNNMIGLYDGEQCKNNFISSSNDIHLSNYSINFVNQVGENYYNCNNSFVNDLSALEIMKIIILELKNIPKETFDNSDSDPSSLFDISGLTNLIDKIDKKYETKKDNKTKTSKSDAHLVKLSESGITYKIIYNKLNGNLITAFPI